MGNNLYNLDGRLALVTGSSRGIGLALAKGLAENGARIVVNGRDAQKAEQAAESLRSAGFDAHAAPFDVIDSAAVEEAVARIEMDIGAIDLLVNNAVMQFRAPLEDFPDYKWHQLLETNISSVFFVGRAVARRMIPRRYGKIINIASVQSEFARRSIAPYTATKGAVRNLTKGMCTDWAGYGLQVNAIAPGYFKTELNRALVEDAEFSAWIEKRTPAGRWGDVEELVGAAVFLASAASSFVNGQTLYIDGGMGATL
jgi:gluconate 5-dehydrogenase